MIVPRFLPTPRFIRTLFLLLLFPWFLFPSIGAQSTLLSSEEPSSSIASLITGAAGDAIQGRQNSLWKRHVRTAWEEKHFPRAFPPSHLSDNIFYLYSSLQENREQSLASLRSLLEKKPDDAIRKRIKHYISNDELNQAGGLLREDTYNRLTLILNHVSSAVTGVLRGQTQPLLQLPVDLVFVWNRFGRCSPRQRKSLFLLERFLSKHPDSPEKAEVEALLHKLEQKKKKKEFRRELELGRFFRKKGKLHRALFHFSNASSLGENPAKAEKEIESIRRRLAERERDRRASLSVLNGEDFFQTEKEKTSYQQTIYALVTQDLDALEENTARFLVDYPASNYADDVQYASTALLNLDRERSEVLESLVSISENYPDANCGQIAAISLHSPDVNPRHDLDEAMKDYHARLRKYILTGGREADEQVYMFSSQVARSPSFAARNLGVLFVIDVLIRGVRSAFASPLSMEDVINKVAFYERTGQSEALTVELRTRLVSIFLKKRQYGKALYYAKKSGAFSEGSLKKIEDRHARQLYVLISEMPDQEMKTSCLQQLISRYPHASIVSQARRDLVPLDEESLYDFQVSREELMRHPELCGRDALNLDPALIDGKSENGELVGEGVKAIREGPVVYRVSGVNSAYELPISDSNRRAVARRIRELREIQERGDKTFPIEISGGFGSRGLEMYPLFLPVQAEEEELHLFH